jgi:hypothetical protein
MRLSRRAAVILATALIALPALGAAQEPVKSFDELNRRLKPGDTVWVTDAGGHETKGRILELTPTAIVLDAGHRRTFAADAVLAVKKPVGRPLLKAALWGSVTGAAAGVVVVAVGDSSGGSGSPPPCPPASEPMCMLPPPPTPAASDSYIIPAGAALGAGLGVLVGAMLPGRMRDVYVAPSGGPGLAKARVSIAPVITPRARGVAVSFAF